MAGERLLYIALERVADEVLARDESDDPVGAVDDYEVPQSERPKHDERPIQRKLLRNTRRRLVNERLLHTEK